MKNKSKIKIALIVCAVVLLIGLSVFFGGRIIKKELNSLFEKGPFYDPIEISDTVSLYNLDSEKQEIRVKSENSKEITLGNLNNIVKACVDKNHLAYFERVVHLGVEPIYTVKPGISEWEVYEQRFIVVDLSSMKEEKFDNQASFNKYCEENGLSFVDWKYSTGWKYELKKLSDDWVVYDFEGLKTDKICYRNSIVYEGFVTKLEETDKRVDITLKIPDALLWELPLEANKGIALSETPTDVYKIDLVTKDEGTYGVNFHRKEPVYATIDLSVDLSANGVTQKD
ncbi:MAG: hypothetical protein E7515_04575 [Ruminococcaceae bacterium]|nr:hypothetical protein [Oscillospiraceae bacterium]